MWTSSIMTLGKDWKEARVHGVMMRWMGHIECPTRVLHDALPCCSVNADKALRAMRRCVIKPNTKTQLLTLTVRLLGEG